MGHPRRHISQFTLEDSIGFALPSRSNPCSSFLLPFIQQHRLYSVPLATTSSSAEASILDSKQARVVQDGHPLALPEPQSPTSSLAVMLAAPTNRMSNSYPSSSPSGTYSSSSYESYAKAPALPSYHRPHDSSSHMQPMPSHLRTAPSSSGTTGHRESWPPLLLPPISRVTHGHGWQQSQQPQRSPSLYSHLQQVSPSYSRAHDPRSLATNRHLRPPSPVRRVSGPAPTVSSIAPRSDNAPMSTVQSSSAVPVANATAPTKKRKRLQRVS